MTEAEVNQIVRRWLEARGYHYRGVLEKGDVPVPNGNRSIKIDHQGFRKSDLDLVWVEAKGSGTNLSELLAGFIKLLYAVYHGGGTGYLAVPKKEAEILKEQEEFLQSLSKMVKILNVEEDIEI